MHDLKEPENYLRNLQLGDIKSRRRLPHTVNSPLSQSERTATGQKSANSIRKRWDISQK